MTDIGDNSGDTMLSFIERVERIQEEIKASQMDRKEVYAEAAAAGWDVKALRRVVKERSLDREELDEFDQLVADYWRKLGR
jgi:uncharacterized protein (UPF0335 family)